MLCHTLAVKKGHAAGRPKQHNLIVIFIKKKMAMIPYKDHHMVACIISMLIVRIVYTLMISHERSNFLSFRNPNKLFWSLGFKFFSFSKSVHAMFIRKLLTIMPLLWYTH